MKNVFHFPMILVLAALVSCPILPAGPETIVLQPGVEGKDTYISDAYPDRNSPISEPDHLYQGCDGLHYYRALMQWDLSSMPKQVKIVSAKMEFCACKIRSRASWRPSSPD